MTGEVARSMFGRLCETILRRRLWWGMGLLFIALGAAAGASRMRPDFSVTAYFGTDDPRRAVLDAYHAFWGKQDDALLILVTAEDSLLTPGRLDLIHRVTEAFDTDADTKRVTSLSDFTWLRSPPGSDTATLERVIDTVPSDPNALAEWAEEIRNNDLIVPTLLSRDAAATAILVEFGVPTDDILKLTPLVERARELLAGFEGEEGLHFAAAGGTAAKADTIAVMMSDQAKLSGLAMLIIIICLAVAFRRPHGVLIPGIAAVVPVIMLFGVMGLVGEPMSLANQSFTTLLPAIAVADAIHLLVRFHEEARRLAPPGERLSADQRRQAIVAALEHLGGACLLTSSTTAAGFLSLRMAQMPMVRNFGTFAALGIAFAYGTVLLILPILLSLTRGGLPTRAPERRSLLDRFLGGSAHFAIHRPWVVVTISMLGLAFFLLAGSRVEIDARLLDALDPDHPTSVANRLVDERLGGLLACEVDLIADGPALKDPKVLTALRSFEGWAEGHEDIEAVTSPASHIAEAARLMTGTSDIPTDPQAVAQLYLLVENSTELQEILDFGYSRGRMVIRSHDRGATSFGELEETLRERLTEMTAGLPLRAELTGSLVMGYRGTNNIAHDLRASLLTALVVIIFVLGLLFRSLRIGALAIVPNVLPLAAGYGVLGLVGWKMDHFSAMIFAVGLSIAVDDTIHLLARHREELAKGKSRDEAITAAVRACGRAVTVTTLILVANLGANALSSFPGMRAMGTVGATIILVALLCDLYLLPALLRLGTPDAPARAVAVAPTPRG